MDRHGLATLWGLSASRCAHVKPWAQPGHPATVNMPRRGGDNRWLWDAAQARAYRNGTAIPHLPKRNAAGDQLDLDDLATELSIPLDRARQMLADGRIRPPDTTPCGVAHWYRRTVPAIRNALATRPGPGAPRQPRGTARASVYATLDAAGGHLDLAELATRAAVSRPTAVKYRREYTAEHYAESGD